MSTTPFGNWNAADLWRPWLQLAPSALVQPVLSGWTFNVNSNNSSAPQTEANVVARHSYGRQLGRIADALHALLLQQDRKALGTQPFADFLSMREEIEQVKAESAAARLERIAADLAMLKRQDEAAYARVRAALQRALEDTR